MTDFEMSQADAHKNWSGVALTLAGCMRDRAEMLAECAQAKRELKELQTSGLIPAAAIGAVSDIIRRLGKFEERV